MAKAPTPTLMAASTVANGWKACSMVSGASSTRAAHLRERVSGRTVNSSSGLLTSQHPESKSMSLFLVLVIINYNPTNLSVSLNLNIIHLDVP